MYRDRDHDRSHGRVRYQNEGSCLIKGLRKIWERCRVIKATCWVVNWDVPDSKQ